MLLSAVVCGPGILRQKNQDNFYLDGIIRGDPASTEICKFENESNGHGIYAVADGMGGEEKGELASFEAVRALFSVRASDNSFRRYLKSCNERIREIPRERGKIVGSTFAGLAIRRGKVFTANIGDSRIYLLRDGLFAQLSVDHNPQLAEGRSHVLSQYLGLDTSSASLMPYCLNGELHTGDIFLLCTDGLTDMLNDDEISEIVRQPIGLTEKAAMLFDSAMDAGGVDNITVALVQAQQA